MLNSKKLRNNLTTSEVQNNYLSADEFVKIKKHSKSKKGMTATTNKERRLKAKNAQKFNKNTSEKQVFVGCVSAISLLCIATILDYIGAWSLISVLLSTIVAMKIGQIVEKKIS